MKRICPKCSSDDFMAVGGLKRYHCHHCNHYFDNEEYEKEDKRTSKAILEKVGNNNPISDECADSLADWGADRPELGGVR